MISDEYKTIMVHIDKCAGTSICNHFDGHPGHNKWNRYQERWPCEWENYFKFAFVRNPWDRVVSSYFHHILLYEVQYKHYLDNSKKSQQKLIKISGQQKNYRITFKDFNYFLSCEEGIKLMFIGNNYNTKFNPCYKYIYDEDMNCQVDFVGRYENLNEDMTYIQQKLGMPIEPIPHTNSMKSKKPHYSAFYNEENIEIIRELYKVDIELFDYEFERVVLYDHNLANTLDWVDKY